MHHNSVFANEVTIKAQYSIVSKQSMIQELVLWYLKLKPKPISTFICNTLVKACLFIKTHKQATIVKWKKKRKKVRNLNLYHKLRKPVFRFGLFEEIDALPFSFSESTPNAIDQFKMLGLSDTSLSSLDTLFSSGIRSGSKYGSTAAMLVSRQGRAQWRHTRWRRYCGVTFLAIKTTKAVPTELWQQLKKLNRRRVNLRYDN